MTSFVKSTAFAFTGGRFHDVQLIFWFWDIHRKNLEEIICISISTRLQHKDLNMDHTTLWYGTYTIVKFDGLHAGHRCF